jgi:hypothetical protein
MHSSREVSGMEILTALQILAATVPFSPPRLSQLRLAA